MNRFYFIIAIVTFFGVPESMFATDLFVGVPKADGMKIELSSCPKKVQKSIYKELKDFKIKDEFYCRDLIYRVDMDGDGNDEYVCLFGCPTSQTYFFILGGDKGNVLMGDGWLERNISSFRIVSLIKRGEFEVLVKSPGGGTGIESNYVQLYKKCRGEIKKIYFGQYFTHEWGNDKQDTFDSKFYSVEGGVFPFEIYQYHGELTTSYKVLNKNGSTPDYVIKKKSVNPLATFVWDPVKFEYVKK